MEAGVGEMKLVNVGMGAGDPPPGNFLPCLDLNSIAVPLAIPPIPQKLQRPRDIATEPHHSD